MDRPDFINNQVIDQETMDDMVAATATALEQVQTSTQLQGFNTDIVVSIEPPATNRARIAVVGGTSSVAWDRVGKRMPVSNSKEYHFVFDDVSGTPISIPAGGNHRVLRVVMEYVQDTLNDTTVSGNARTQLIDNKRIYSIGGTEVLTSTTPPIPVAPANSIVLVDVTVVNTADEDFTIAAPAFSQTLADFMYRNTDGQQASNPSDLAEKLAALLTAFSFGWTGTPGEDDHDLGDSVQQHIADAVTTETLNNAVRYLMKALQIDTPGGGFRAGADMVALDVADVAEWDPAFPRGTQDISSMVAADRTTQRVVKKMVFEMGSPHGTIPGSSVVGSPVNVVGGVAPQWPQDPVGKKRITEAALTQVEQQHVSSALQSIAYEVGSATRDATAAAQTWDIPGADNVGADFSSATPVPTVVLGTPSPTQYGGDGPAFNVARQYFGNVTQDDEYSIEELSPRKNVTSAIAATVATLALDTDTLAVVDEDTTRFVMRHDLPLGFQAIGAGNFTVQDIGLQTIEILKSRQKVTDGGDDWFKFVTPLARDKSLHSMWSNLLTHVTPHMVLDDKWGLPYNNDINETDKDEMQNIVHTPSWAAEIPFSLSAPNGEYGAGDTRAENAGIGTNIVAPDTVASLEKQIDTTFDLVVRWRVGRNWPLIRGITSSSSNLRPPIAFRIYKTSWGIALTWNLEISNAAIMYGGFGAGEPGPTSLSRPDSIQWRDKTIKVKRDVTAYDGHMMFFGDAMRAFRWAGDNTADWTTNTGVTHQLIGTQGAVQGEENSLVKGFPTHENTQKTGGIVHPDANTLCMPLMFMTLKQGVYTADSASVDTVDDGTDWPQVEHLARLASATTPAFVGFVYQVDPGALHPDALLTSHSMGFIHNLQESDP